MLSKWVHISLHIFFHKCALLFLALTISNFCHAQDLKLIDSLESIIKTTEGETKLNAHYKLCSHYNEHDLKLALECARQLLKESKLHPDSKIKAMSLCNVAEAFKNSGIGTDSIKILSEQCLKIGNAFDHANAKLNSNYNLGEYYKMKAEFETAVEYFLKVINLAENSDVPIMKANALHSIGIIKDFQKKYDEAIEYFDKASVIGQNLNDTNLIFISTQSKAIANFNKGNTKEGIQAFLEAKKNASSIIQKTDIRSNLAYAYTMMNKMDSAQYYLVESKKLSDEFGTNRQKISTSTALLNFHRQQGNWEEVYPILISREKLIEERRSQRWLRINAEDHVDYYKAIGDFENAFLYQNKFITYNDSILNEKNQFAIKELEEKYETEKKEILISEQQKEIKNKKTQRNLFLIIGALGIGFLLQRIRKNKQINEQQDIIKQKEIEKLKKENTIMSLSSMLEGQQTERKRIAQDLHDGLGGLLSSAKLQLRKVKTEIQKLQDLSIFSSAEDLIDDAYKEVRRISHDMMPGALVKLGLFAAVEDLAYQTNEANEIIIQTQWYTEDNEMDDKTKISLYRIIQEAITNTVKYAEANQMIIQISRNNNFYQLTIEDDGKGFDSNLESSHGIGLKNIKSRIKYLEGEFDLISQPGEGVSMEISIPIYLS